MPERSRNLAFWTGLGALAVLFLAAWTLEHAWTERCLADSAARTDAVVTGRESGSGRGGPTFALGYDFVDVHGRKHTGWQRVSRQRFETAPVGASVPLLYCTAYPARHTLELARHKEQLSGLILTTTIAAGVLALALLLMSLKRAFDRWREPAATQAEAEQWSSTANRNPRYVSR